MLSLTSALWRGTTGGFLRARPGLTLPNLYPACQPGTFGKDCGHPCQCPGETWACHPASGACVCAAGYHGTDCRQRECGPLPRGTWGSVCHSGMQGGGEQFTGLPCHVQGCCRFDSSPQRMSQTLSLPAGCPPGRYGSGCVQVCKCLNGGSCDTATGACHCPAGFLGADCSLGEEPGCRAGRLIFEFLGKGVGPCWPAYGRTAPCPPASLILGSPIAELR